ncbi:DUF1330 domain-containing protein [Bosea sp. 124]|uniref:DUF1330 domain-containing protein n=1 Tax=Bosea sp. 124 TaxID=2135642 RepID=UPI000D393640|nr:DUF1330 domain-containing protein [Bosea sp. 124]
MRFSGRSFASPENDVQDTPNPARAVGVSQYSVEHAQRVHDSAAYQEAMALLGNGAERDIRIVEGV